MAVFFLTVFLVSCTSIQYIESSVRGQTSNHTLWKRDSFFNFGGADHSQTIKGDHNHVLASTQNPNNTGKETMIRKAAHDIGRVLGSGADLAAVPTQWLFSILENWPTYLVCITVLVICGTIIYCCIQQKLSSFAISQNGIEKLYNIMNNQEKKTRVQYIDNIFEI